MGYNTEIELMVQELMNLDPNLTWGQAYRCASAIVEEACK